MANIVNGEKIKILMGKQGLSQTDLAKKAGLTRTYISEIINGKYKRPSYAAINKIAVALDVELEEILAAADYKVDSAIADLKKLDIDALITYLKRAGFPDHVIDIVKLLHAKEISPEQMEALKAILKLSKNK